MSKTKLVEAAMGAFLTLLASNTVLAEQAIQANTTEACYGIAKKGMNDCATASSSCASTATSDKQKDAFILLPKGSCDRIVGGSTKKN